VAIVSQSGAFIITRMSNLETLDPAFAISLGNQLDLTASDVVAALAKRDDLDAIGVYTEGFNNLDGLELLRSISVARASGKQVVFYKAGRTASGQSAAAGHTAAVAGDYDVCQAAAAQAGALVADTFKEFEQLLELCTAMHSKEVNGVSIGAISNAGFETVGMADAIQGTRYSVEMATLSAESIHELDDVLETNGLSRLVNARNPLDITPMATEEVYEGSIRVLLKSENVDAVVVGVVPLTLALETTAEGVDKPGTLADRLPPLFNEAKKPMIVVVDAGPRYEPLVHALRSGGVPVFPSADQAIRSLGRYLCHRAG
jgi:acyl-CoA synthetase (NDP forming)